ncbi:hypothetical protein KAR91_26260 [Candidatus Pacearchaeota archaeon]|nr:hypothetical protein [Candidatus Pacearchaeota archaeon]
MNKQQFQSIHRVHRFAANQKEWTTVQTLEYVHPFLIGMRRNISAIPQSSELQQRLRTARIARRKRQRKQLATTAAVKAYWEESAYFGRR